jgi:quercetin dioxygenase-like cupin family protein/uncharacterized membrane protein YphA (DoxX/SURF4 family)
VIYARLAIGAAFLSAVGARFGLWDGTLDLDHFPRFIQLTAEVNSFMPAATIPLLAWAATFAELSLGLALITGFHTHVAGVGAAILLALFGTAMALSYGVKEPMDYSVFSASAGALLLALLPDATRTTRADADAEARSSGSEGKDAMFTQEITMKTQTVDGLVKTASMPWTPLVESGVDTTGISVKPLRTEPATGRAVSFVLRFEPGAKYPYHDHPAGEELFVLSGNCLIEGTLLEAGDYLYTPAGSKHSVQTDTGCTVLFQVPEEVMIL